MTDPTNSTGVAGARLRDPLVEALPATAPPLTRSPTPDTSQKRRRAALVSDVVADRTLPQFENANYRFFVSLSSHFAMMALHLLYGYFRVINIMLHCDLD
jgi:hypothetical protein